VNADLSPTRSIQTLSPFRRSPDNPLAVPAKLEGTIPDWLRGEVVRTCPAVFETNGWRAHHWFDGLGMIYAFRIRCQDDDARRQRNGAKLDSAGISRLVRAEGK
jgi:carotenoid cleavage dioxygenase-like enzyme